MEIAATAKMVGSTMLKASIDSQLVTAIEQELATAAGTVIAMLGSSLQAIDPKLLVLAALASRKVKYFSRKPQDSALDSHVTFVCLDRISLAALLNFCSLDF